MGRTGFHLSTDSRGHVDLPPWALLSEVTTCRLLEDWETISNHDSIAGVIALEESSSSEKHGNGGGVDVDLRRRQEWEVVVSAERCRGGRRSACRCQQVPRHVTCGQSLTRLVDTSSRCGFYKLILSYPIGISADPRSACRWTRPSLRPDASSPRPAAPAVCCSCCLLLLPLLPASDGKLC